MTFSDQHLFQFCLLMLYLIGLINFVHLWFFPVPYGRLQRSGLGPSMPSSLAWCLFLSPMVWLTIIVFPFGQHATNPKSWALIAPFLIHYVHRTCIYPLRLHQAKSTHRMPIVIFVVGLSFSLLNAYLQARELSHYKDYSNDAWLWWRVLGGFLLFVWGMQINIWADHILIGLKGDSGEYKIPKGGWFELVSCPNFFGELIEWLGWFIMTGDMVSLGFFLFSLSNLVPRAYSCHKWYLEKFRNYPKTRKAIFPFVF